MISGRKPFKPTWEPLSCLTGIDDEQLEWCRSNPRKRNEFQGCRGDVLDPRKSHVFCETGSYPGSCNTVRPNGVQVLPQAAGEFCAVNSVQVVVPLPDPIAKLIMDLGPFATMKRVAGIINSAVATPCKIAKMKIEEDKLD